MRKRTKQSNKRSIQESITQAIVGLLFSFIIQYFMYPIMKIPVTLFQNITITAVFFVMSIIRGYIIRRFFNKLKN